MIEQVRFNAGKDWESTARALSDTFRQLNSILSMQPGIRSNVDRVQLLDNSVSAGGLLAWKNTQESDIIIHFLMIDIVTGVSSLAGNFGTAAGATTSSDNLMDAATLGNTARVASSADSLDAGTNGRASQRLIKGQFITGTVDGGLPSPAGLVAYAHIVWSPILS